MLKGNRAGVVRVENEVIRSAFLARDVKVDLYLPAGGPGQEEMSLLLVNDGQDLLTMNFKGMLQHLYDQNQISPLLCVGLHCSADRKNEYGTAKIRDYKGRGAKAGLYSRFVFEELIPFIRKKFPLSGIRRKAFAGFSLGGLSAMDIVWNNQLEFDIAGVFSGSFWWRSKSQEDKDFDETIHRIMHQQVKAGVYAPWLRFFFQVGALDEIADRNRNGVIDAIDDTTSLIELLKSKGYTDGNIRYLELKDGKHDVPTWARAFPEFLKWGWGTTGNN
jgi:enterochelin esterase-like enzyme